MFFSWKGKYENPTLLQVSRENVFKALNWLVFHNPLYGDVVIGKPRLNSLPKNESIKVKNIVLGQEGRDFALLDTGPSNNDQFEDCRKNKYIRFLSLFCKTRNRGKSITVLCGNSIFSWIGYFWWTFQWIWHCQFRNTGFSHSFSWWARRSEW